MQHGDAGEHDGDVVGFEVLAQLVAHVRHARRVQLVEALQQHDRLAQHRGPARQHSLRLPLLVLKRLVHQVDQRRDHVRREQLARGDQRRRHLQVVLALQVLGVTEHEQGHHLKTIDDHEAELVLGGNAQRGGDVAGFLIYDIGVRTQLELRRAKSHHLDGLEIAEGSFVSKHLAVHHADQRLAKLILR